ncbi:hypothetical protein F2A38_08650 [Pseudomonas chlororaphis]|uniref:Uncharacterized protein n=1 Tax=Pseudomonas chlororaphis TaxID=587753 RepID=A0AB34C849_9PSED|nr:hypothetical protein [Pseudomonas chlororaphis]KAA5843351.1 hypothetical protein F2A38_08650 [Pseudomonas chlororaphis]
MIDTLLEQPWLLRTRNGFDRRGRTAFGERGISAAGQTAASTAPPESTTHGLFKEIRGWSTSIQWGPRDIPDTVRSKKYQLNKYEYPEKIKLA